MSSNTNAVSSSKAASASSTGRPSLKNLTRARVPRAGILGCTLAAVAAISWKVLISDRHKRDVASFYK